MRNLMRTLGLQLVLVVLVWLALASLIGAGIGPGLPAKVKVSADPKKILADGASTSIVIASVEDKNHVPVADGTKVTFTTTWGSLGIATDTKFTEKYTTNGVATATLTSATIPGRARISAVAESVAGHTSVKFYERKD